MKKHSRQTTREEYRVNFCKWEKNLSHGISTMGLQSVKCGRVFFHKWPFALLHQKTSEGVKLNGPKRDIKAPPQSFWNHIHMADFLGRKAALPHIKCAKLLVGVSSSLAAEGFFYCNTTLNEQNWISGFTVKLETCLPTKLLHEDRDSRETLPSTCELTSTIECPSTQFMCVCVCVQLALYFCLWIVDIFNFKDQFKFIVDFIYMEKSTSASKPLPSWKSLILIRVLTRSCRLLLLHIYRVLVFNLCFFPLYLTHALPLDWKSS